MRFLEKSLGGIMKTFPTLSLGTDNHLRFCQSNKAIKILVEAGGHGPSVHQFTFHQPLCKSC